MEIVFFSFPLLLSVKCLLSIFICEICYYYFWVIFDFSSREIYSVGQLVDPKDRKTCMHIRLFIYIYIHLI